jgi:lipoprotein-releasing system ATP-binding protein
MGEPLLAARGLHRTYRTGPRDVSVLRGLDLEVGAGEAVAVVGDSGVGKSTLLHLLGALDRPDRGELRHLGRDVLAMPPRARAEYRNRDVGFVFQFHHLLPEFSALENVLMPLRVGRRADAGARERAVALLHRLGLGDRLDHRPGALSGGEQQRVAVARAVVGDPTVVLADEPTGNLDPPTGAAVFGVLMDLQVEQRFALIVATHSERIARGCHRILRLDDGALRPVEDAEARDFFRGVAG